MLPVECAGNDPDQRRRHDRSDGFAESLLNERGVGRMTRQTVEKHGGSEVDTVFAGDREQSLGRAIRCFGAFRPLGRASEQVPVFCAGRGLTG
jgi:hypothetical protein